MARWKLTEPHYLRVPGTKWEYTEIDRATGKPKRTQYDVPQLLDPNIESDWNYRYDQWSGDIIISDGHEAQPKDIIFVGPVTPGMLPLDDEAKAISAQAAKGLWKPTAGLDPESQNTSFSAQLLSGMIDKMTAVQAGIQQGAAIPGMDEFMQSMKGMMEKQTEILAMLTQATLAKPASSGTINRRAVG